MQKISIKKILKKKNKIPIVCLSTYLSLIAKTIYKHCDIILVGDSLGMVLYGMKSTREVKLETMIAHGKAVKKSVKKSLVVIDMPYRTYTNKSIALKNAKRVVRLTKCDGIKLEGGKEVTNIIKHLTRNKIPVMGHVGLLPQTAVKFKVRGKKPKEKKRIMDDAIAVSNAGVFATIIECVIEELAKNITKKIKVPTIGIGASQHCDGQILVVDDMLGISNFSPKFVKKYANINDVIKNSVIKYAKEVKLRKFPTSKNVYK